MLSDLITKKEQIDLMSTRLEIWSLVFCAIVAAGVVGEAVVGIRLFMNGRAARSIQKQIDEESEQKHRSEISDLRSENAESAVTTQFVSARLARSFSDEQREILKNRLSAYAGQEFRVLQIGPTDTEARDFATDIISALVNCGWSARGNLEIVMAKESTILMSDGVSFKLSDADSESIQKVPRNGPEICMSAMPKTPRAFFELWRAMMDIGVKLGALDKYSTWKPIPDGVIEIAVSKIPT